jgi:hypothetical protein
MMIRLSWKSWEVFGKINPFYFKNKLRAVGMSNGGKTAGRGPTGALYSLLTPVPCSVSVLSLKVSERPMDGVQQH